MLQTELASRRCSCWARRRGFLRIPRAASDNDQGRRLAAKTSARLLLTFVAPRRVQCEVHESECDGPEARSNALSALLAPRWPRARQSALSASSAPARLLLRKAHRTAVPLRLPDRRVALAKRTSWPAR
eukprot:1785807-Prymnesium_polylepis.1